ncbi:MAG: adenylate kinase [Planctomycetes bacterium]|nr:adenylate kinase [Planctomycetota bacterium]
MFLGPPGSGKGTQAKVISSKIGAKHYSTGDMLRDAVKNNTDLGKKAKEFMSKGELVPDSLILSLINEVFLRDNPNRFILDGFPRTVNQALELDKLLQKIGRPLTTVLYFDIPDEEVVRRITGRRTCTKCGSNFHIEFNKSKNDGICDKCNVKLILRDDDKEATIRNRLKVYKDSTSPLINLYKEKGILRKIDASASIDLISESIIKFIS